MLLRKISIPMGLPCGLVIKNPPTNAGDVGSIPGSGRSPGKGNDDPLQYSCLQNSMDREARRLQSTVSQGVRHDLVSKQQHYQYQLKNIGSLNIAINRNRK